MIMICIKEILINGKLYEVGFRTKYITLHFEMIRDLLTRNIYFIDPLEYIDPLVEEHFITLAEYREKRIDEILNDPE